MQTETSAMPLRPAHAPGGHDEAATDALGFWLYLMSDLIVFAALFATYLVMVNSTAGGPAGRELFHLPGVLLETVLLLCSSAAYGLAMVAMQQGDARKVLAGLGAAFLLGLGFVALEAVEFSSLIAEGATPQRSGFLSAFFTLVGTHGLHVSFGLLWMAVMMVQAAGQGLTAAVQSRLVRLGMFWHFLDIVWIALFSVVYLMGVL